VKLEIRLGDADREKHGGDEWLEFDPSVYNDMPLSQQAALERQMIPHGGVSLWRLLRGGEARNETAAGRVSMAWLARLQAGLTEPTFEKFDIDQLEVHTRLNPGAAVPLGGGSTTSSETTPESGQPSAPAPSKKPSRSSSRR